MVTRRDLLKLSAASAVNARAAGKKKIAAMVTEYRRDSHADVIVGRLLEGYDYEGQRRAPEVQVTSMYTDQVPANDMSREMSARYGFPICPTIAEALTLGGNSVAVDGVVLVGEHGNYAENQKGQKLYPRYELYRDIVHQFRRSGRAVPVFCDKYLSFDWELAKWMYDQSRELEFPLMAGSSLPLTWRRPPLELELETPVTRAVAAFYGGKEAYGFHALEALQCMVERRSGGETGIASVECIDGPGVWNWTGSNAWAGRLLDVALQRSESRKPGAPQDNVRQPVLFVVVYRSGLRAAVYLLNGHVQDATFAADTRDRESAVSTEIWLQPGRPYSHFSALVRYIEQMIAGGRAAYPVERTLLTTGALAALMDSSFRHRPVETPHLNIVYSAPSESLFSRGPVPQPASKPG